MNLLLPLIVGLLAFGQEAPRAAQQGKGRAFERIVIERDDYAVFFDLYPHGEGTGVPDGQEPMLVLFHDSRGSRGQFRDIAPRLTAAGYTCLAVDLGLGRESRGVKNRTAKIARERGHDVDFAQAQVDLEAALLWAREHHLLGPVVALGDGYSAGLALVTASLRPDLVDGALAFSPSECFSKIGKGATWVTESLAECRSPVFLAGAPAEAEVLRGFLEAIPVETRTLYVPTEGTYGTEALQAGSPGHDACWEAVEAFLRAHFPVQAPSSEDAGGAGGTSDGPR
jgi:pimeloyl-ACP methyl ester carboxylesterase